jgi:hypothetical protein
MSFLRFYDGAVPGKKQKLRMKWQNSYKVIEYAKKE